MVTNTQKVISTLAHLIVEIIDVARTGAQIGNLGKIIAISSDMKTLLSAAPQAFPEVQNLSGEDMAKIGESSYEAIAKVIDHLKTNGLIH